MSKVSKHRDCPALARRITNAECGAGRQSAIRCPAECPHHPFGLAAYDSQLALSERLDSRIIEIWSQEVGKLAAAEAAARIDAQAKRDSTLGFNAGVVRELFFRRDGAGRTFAERFLAAGAPGLNNDERVLLAGKATMRVGLVRVGEVRGDRLVSAVDLLNPALGEFLVLDRGFHAGTHRSALFFGWFYTVPYFTRVSGNCINWPDSEPANLDPLTLLAEIVHRAGGPAPGTPLGDHQAWLGEHFIDIAAGVEQARFKRLIREGRALDPRISPPPLDRPLDEIEVFDRLDSVRKLFPNENDLARLWYASCPDWVAAVHVCEIEGTQSHLDELEKCLALAWGVLGGIDGPASIELNSERLRLAFSERWSRFRRDVQAPAEASQASIAALCPSQPALAVALIADALDVSKNRSAVESKLLLLPLLVAVTWVGVVAPELEAALRESP